LCFEQVVFPFPSVTDRQPRVQSCLTDSIATTASSLPR
jgi:hypothetical protein